MDHIENYANMETPTPGSAWSSLDVDQRVALVSAVIENGPEQYSSRIEVATAKEDGQVIVRLKAPLAASRRGPLLLDVEAYLKKSIDDALVVWLEAVGDRNSLRNLRGIEVKS